MNKKKRALALGLAATQLTALSAVVAPLTAFANVTQGGIVTDVVITSDNQSLYKVVSFDGSTLIYRVKNDTTTELPMTPSDPSYPACGVKFKVAADANVAMTGSTNGLAALSDVQNDGFVMWLSATKSADMDFVFRKYSETVTAKDNGSGVLFYKTDSSGTETALTKKTEIDYYDGNKYPGFAFVDTVANNGAVSEQTIKVVRQMSIVPEITVADSAEKPKNAAEAKAALEAEGGLEFKFSEFGKELTSIVNNDQREDYTVTVSEAKPESAESEAKFDVTVKFVNDKRSGMAFAAAKNGEYTLSNNDKTLTMTVSVPLEAAAVTVEAQPNSSNNFTKVTDSEENLITEAKKQLGSDLADLVEFALRTVGSGTVPTLEAGADKDFTVTANDGKVVKDGTTSKINGVEFTLTVTLTENGLKEANFGKKADGTAVEDTAEVTITVPAEAVPTVTVGALVTDDLNGAANAAIEFKKADADAVDAVVKENDTLKLTITPKNGFMFKTAPTVTAAVGTNPATVTKTANKDEWTITVPAITEGETNNLVVTVTGEVAKPVIKSLTATKAIKDAPVETDQLDRYKYNYDKYTVREAKETADGWTIPVEVARGALQGTATPGTNGKNVLVVIGLPNLKGIDVLKNDTSIKTAAPTWFNTADRFVSRPAEDTQYVTLWISLNDARMTDGVEYKITATNAEQKKLTVTFTDTTEYTLEKDTALIETDYTVTLGTVTNGKAAVTVTPVGGKVITGGTITLADSSTAALTAMGNGSYAAEVDVNALISDTDIANGVTAAKITNTNLTVNVSEPSDIKATNITAAIEEPETMTGDVAGLEKYKKNRALYANSVTWNAARKTATVKVPSALMTGSSAPGISAANVCLVMELETKLTNEQKTAVLANRQIEAVDIADGSKFVSAPDLDKDYMVLWINAHSDAFTNGSKGVIYEASGKVIATVNLIDIPVVKKTSDVLSRVDLAGKTAEEAKTDVITEAKQQLALPEGTTADDLTFTVGTIPTEEGYRTVEVTVAARPGAEVVLSADGTTAAAGNTLKIKVPVTVPAKTTYTVTIDTANIKNGTVTTDKTTAKKGETVTLTVAPNSGYKADTVTVKDSAGETVTVTANEFVMPAGNVTVTATFTANSTTKPSGGSSRPSGGSSRPSGGSSYPSVSSQISSADKDSDLELAGETNVILGYLLKDMAENNLTVTATVNSSFKWTFKASEVESADSTLNLKMTESTVSAAEIKKIEGKAITETIAFETAAAGLGKSATITVRTSARPTDTQPKFANLYRVKADGTLEFVKSAKIDKDGYAVLPAAENGKYAVLAADETKQPGDIDNDCNVRISDVQLLLDRYIYSASTITRAQDYKLDYDGSGVVRIADIQALLTDYIQGKFD